MPICGTFFDISLVPDFSLVRFQVYHSCNGLEAGMGWQWKT